MKLSGMNPSAGPTIAGIIGKGRIEKLAARQEAETATKATNVSTGKVRDDFRAALEQTIQSRMAAADPKTLAPFRGEDGRFDVGRLPEEAQRELVRLQGAAEGFESFFVKDLLSKMRPPSMTDKPSAMTNFAKDLMDQAVADSAAKGRGSIGIAKTIFLTMGEQVVRKGIGTAIITAREEKK